MEKYINQGTFEKFSKDLEKSWHQLIKLYIQEQSKINFRDLIKIIRRENKLD